MTPRENFFRMLKGQSPERFPLDLPMTPPVVDRVEQYLGTRDVAAAFACAAVL